MNLVVPNSASFRWVVIIPCIEGWFLFRAKPVSIPPNVSEILQTLATMYESHTLLYQLQDGKSETIFRSISERDRGVQDPLNRGTQPTSSRGCTSHQPVKVRICGMDPGWLSPASGGAYEEF